MQVGREFESRWRKRFEDFAARSDDDAGIAGWSQSGLRTRVRLFLRLWNRAEHRGTWLDLGCVDGTYTRILGERGLTTVGCDYSFIALGKARERSPGTISWAAADVTKLPFRDGCADGVLCFGVTQALASSSEAVREIAGVLKPGGAAWVDALNSWCVAHMLASLRQRMRGRPPHLRYERPGRFAAALREAGFNDIRVHWIPLVPGRFERLQRVLEGPVMQVLFRWIPPLGALVSHSFFVTGTRTAQRTGRTGAA
jgi:SAM-dependent methyltransferase